jgi:hypothetical protein
MSKNEDFEKLIQPYEHTLLTIERRLYFIEAVEEKWNEILEETTFTVKNDVFWMMYQDMYMMLVIELRSYLKALTETGGFLNQMNNFLSKLRVPGKGKITPPKGAMTFLNFQPSEDEIKEMEKQEKIRYRKEFQAGVQGTIEKLFPRLKDVKDHTSPDYKVKQEDIKDLKDRLSFDEHDIIDCRNELAHRHDQGVKHKTNKIISITDLRELTNTLEDLLNSFRQILDHSTYGYNDMNYAGSKQVAADFVELVTIGSINNIFGEFGIPQAIGDSQKAQSTPVYFRQFRQKYWENNKIKPLKKRTDPEKPDE